MSTDKNKLINSLIGFLFLMLGAYYSILFAEEKQATSQLNAALENPGHVDKPSWFKSSFLDIGEDISEARETNKNILLYFYQDGCPYCKKLIQDNFGNRDISQYTQKNYEVIAINMWGDKEVIDRSGKSMSEKQFAEKYRIMFTPTLVFLDTSGATKKFRINGYYHPNKFFAALKYFSNKDPQSLSFRHYYAKNKSGKKISGKLYSDKSYLQAPYNLQANKRAANKPLLVMFEQKQCPNCVELHEDILQRDISKQLLAKFDVVLLDQWSEKKLTIPDGRVMSIRSWADLLNIQTVPSFVFFDQNNKEVFRAEAYLKAFHTQGSMDYVVSKGYLEQSNFQRWLGAKSSALEDQGEHVDLWK